MCNWDHVDFYAHAISIKMQCSNVNFHTVYISSAIHDIVHSSSVNIAHFKLYIICLEDFLVSSAHFNTLSFHLWKWKLLGDTREKMYELICKDENKERRIIVWIIKDRMTDFYRIKIFSVGQYCLVFRMRGKIRK